jgi:predicted ATPase
MKLREELGKLVHAEILFQKGRPPRCTYSFKHALIQDAAYQSLLKKKRQQFHQRIAETLEQRFGETAESQPELLAHHFTEAREKEKAIAYWLKAGQRCQARSAVAEAIDHLSKGCKLLQTLPQSPQRDARELEIQMSLGSVLIQAKGYAAAEVAATFQHARTLCERIGPGAPLFHVTLGMWMFHLVRADLDDCMRLAREIMRLADAQADPGAVMEAHFALGCTLYYRGEFARAAQHASQGGALYDADRCRFHAQFTGQNSGVALMVYGALALWNLGYADQAVEQAQQAVQLAASLADPFSHCVALFHCGWLHYYCGSASQVNRCAEAGVAVAHEPGFVFYENLAVTNRGAAMLLEEDIDPDHIQKGIDEIRHGLSGFLSTGAGVHLSHPYSMLADALCRLGKFDEAQAELDNAFQHARRSNELFGEAELYRIQGEILLARSTENQHAAEQAFRKAIEIALLRESRAWQLRATVSLSHLLIQQGRQNEARAALSDIYNRFTEGFQTRDLIRAKTLLDQL